MGGGIFWKLHMPRHFIITSNKKEDRIVSNDSFSANIVGDLFEMSILEQFGLGTIDPYLIFAKQQGKF